MILEIQMSVPGLTLFVLVPCEILPLSHIVSSSPFRYLPYLCMSSASRDLFQEAEKHPLDCFDANTELSGTDFKRWWWHLGKSGEYNLSVLQMFLLICQIYLISAIFEPGGYNQERRNSQISVPRYSFLMTQKVPFSAKVVVLVPRHTPFLIGSHFSSDIFFTFLFCHLWGGLYPVILRDCS